MSRFENTPELFGYGAGSSTSGQISCCICGHVYNKDLKEGGDYITTVPFAGQELCDCCFEKVEKEILRRIDDIIPWYCRILKSQADRLEKRVDDFRKLSEIRVPLVPVDLEKK